MWLLLFTLVAAVLVSSRVTGKTVTGLFKSEAARRQKGQFITKFMYQGGEGLLVCRLENSALATEKESRLLLYQDMDSDLDNLSCSERLAKAQFTIPLSQEEHNQTIPRQSSPTAWQVLYADRYTCQERAAVPSHADLSFTVLLFNADSAGNPLEHFSAEEAGLHSFYFLLLLAYFIACCIYVQPLYQALRKGGPMHTVLKVLTTALALQGCSALCNYVHLARCSRDGTGIPLMGSLAEFWDMVSQVSMLYMLLSLCMGWTLSRGRKPQSRPLQWEQSPASRAVAVGGVITQVRRQIIGPGTEICFEREQRPSACLFSGGAAAVGAVLRVGGRTSQLPRPAEPGGTPPHGPEGEPGPAAGLRPLPDHLHREEHPQERLLPHLRQRMLPVVPLSPRPRPRVRGLQQAPAGEGGDHRCDPLPVHRHGDPLPALPVSFPLLGGVLPLLRVPATHHVQDQPPGALLSTSAVTVQPVITKRGRTCNDTEASPFLNVLLGLP
ncbi:integral membrane protein GPR180 isoform X1 [Brachyistius frenatus]|uniref:integral membrane protein GPR180 isoform X1 n=1 Tax=Brachyistius frenatus TaxID=100188 RepID=UPI0037E8FB45